MTPQPRRKKWTEAEEKTLLDKYGEMSRDGTLSKMKTREKKYKPISLHVNSIHHNHDPVSYPWQWTWKDVSTKVQNMRHQYSLVKQKIKKQESSSSIGEEEFDWMDGITHWSNFLRYKEVFGDVPIAFNGGSLNVGFDGREIDMVAFEQLGQISEGDFVGNIDGVENGVMDLDFDYDGEENNCEKNETCGKATFVCEDSNEANFLKMRRKRKALKGLEKRAFGFLANQLEEIKEMEARFEKREEERENERRKIDKKRDEIEKDRENLRRQRVQEFESMEIEAEERDKRRREESSIRHMEFEGVLNKRRSEWKKKMDNMLSQHRVEMSEIQARILNEQQNLTSQFLGIVTQWTGHGSVISDHNASSSHYMAQMIQNLHHENGGLVDGRVEGDNQEDQFIVDG